MAELDGNAIVVGLDAPFSTPKRSNRVVKQATKVRDTARQLEDTPKETKKSTRYATRAASNENGTDRTTEPKKGTGSSNDGRAMCRTTDQREECPNRGCNVCIVIS
jgi:hypothetical protein